MKLTGNRSMSRQRRLPRRTRQSPIEPIRGRRTPRPQQMPSDVGAATPSSSERCGEAGLLMRREADRSRPGSRRTDTAVGRAMSISMSTISVKRRPWKDRSRVRMATRIGSALSEACKFGSTVSRHAPSRDASTLRTISAHSGLASGAASANARCSRGWMTRMSPAPPGRQRQHQECGRRHAHHQHESPRAQGGQCFHLDAPPGARGPGTSVSPALCECERIRARLPGARAVTRFVQRI